jgi:hypothetical protein
MNKWAAKWTATLLSAALLAGTANAQSSSAFDFGYKIAGSSQIKPVQVFDTGKETVIQMPADFNFSALPSIFADTLAGRVLLDKYRQEPPYVYLPTLERNLLMVLGAHKVVITYTGAQARGEMGVQFGMAKPEIVGSVIPLPKDANEVMRERNQRLASPPVQSAQINSDRQSETIELLRARLASTEEALAAVKQKITEQPVLKQWTLTRADGNVKNSIERWLRDEQYTLIWEIPDTFGIGLIDVTVQAPQVTEAVKTVISNLATAQYPIEVKEYSNKVIRILKKS